MSLLKVAELWIYPVKSLGGIRVDTAMIEPKGLQHDRRWMLVDEHHQFLTQRSLPILALFKLHQHADGFLISYKDQQILLPYAQQGLALTATVWDDVVAVFEVSKQHSDWFSAILGFTCRLVFFPSGNPRAVDKQYAMHDDQVSLADGYPILVIGQSSLDDLNAKLEAPVPMDRFRPNIVFTGGAAFEEDEWKQFRIADGLFAGVKPCARCVLTTVDQQTALKGVEPLATLSTYRKTGNKVLFGQNVLQLTAHATIRVGDAIEIIE